MSSVWVVGFSVVFFSPFFALLPPELFTNVGVLYFTSDELCMILQESFVKTVAENFVKYGYDPCWYDNNNKRAVLAIVFLFANGGNR